MEVSGKVGTLLPPDSADFKLPWNGSKVGTFLPWKFSEVEILLPRKFSKVGTLLPCPTYGHKIKAWDEESKGCALCGS
jgi:hypothetical protein